jgi:hypothetical protein
MEARGGAGGSSPPEGFEKSLQIAIYRVRALLALATKVAPGRTPAGLSALTS